MSPPFSRLPQVLLEVGLPPPQAFLSHCNISLVTTQPNSRLGDTGGDIRPCSPPPPQATLRRLLDHLSLVASFHAFNRMNAQNIAVCFGPVLLTPSQDPPRPAATAVTSASSTATASTPSEDITSAVDFKRHIEVLHYLLQAWPGERGGGVAPANPPTPHTRTLVGLFARPPCGPPGVVAALGVGDPSGMWHPAQWLLWGGSPVLKEVYDPLRSALGGSQTHTTTGGNPPQCSQQLLQRSVTPPLLLGCPPHSQCPPPPSPVKALGTLSSPTMFLLVPPHIPSSCAGVSPFPPKPP